MSLGRKVYPHEWDQENERVIVNSKNKELAIINTIIQKYKVKLETDFFILDSQFKIVSSQMLKRRFLDLDEKEKKTNKRLTSICFQIFELNVVKSAHNSLSVRQCKCEQNNFVKHPDVSGQGQLFMYIKSLV
jgi:phosphoribosylformylglycinamidine (FGAM) synthase PurS component